MAQGDFERVRWELDENWLRLLKVERLQALQAAGQRHPCKGVAALMHPSTFEGMRLRTMVLVAIRSC